MTLLAQRLLRLAWTQHNSLLHRCLQRRSSSTQDAKPADQSKPSDDDPVENSTKELIDYAALKEDKKKEREYELSMIEKDTNIDIPKKHIFQMIARSQHPDACYTLEDAATFELSDRVDAYFKYPKVTNQYNDFEYCNRAIQNEYTNIHAFPDQTDFLFAGASLTNSAAAYYIKKGCSKAMDALVIDKSPYGTHNCTALCNGLISTQSMCQDVWRCANVSKELIRELQRDILCTPEDFAAIKYRPCTHLVLWQEKDSLQVVETMVAQMEDGLYYDAKLPNELEATFPWLKATDSDIALGSHGNSDEALVDPIALRNLYRTLAQARGANFVAAELLDFNTRRLRTHRDISPSSACSVVVRMIGSNQLRACGYALVCLSLGHNTPFMEERSEMDGHMREGIRDLHFIQPRLRVIMTFHSQNAPVTNFPVITDTDGSTIIKESFSGVFKIYLPYEESEHFLEDYQDAIMDVDSEDPFVNRYHKTPIFGDYFEKTVKPRIVKRIPSMEDAQFEIAMTGFESYNTHDGLPVLGMHPYHRNVILNAAHGSRMMNYAPMVGAIYLEYLMLGCEETYDLTQFYWHRVIGNRKLPEFSSLIK